MKHLSAGEPRRPPFIWIGAGFLGAGLVGFLIFRQEWIIAASIFLFAAVFVLDRMIPRW